LAASLLIVAQRFGWSGIGSLGVVLTYGTFVLRRGFMPAAEIDGPSVMAIAAYWITFEAADIATLRRRDSLSAAPLFLLNAAGVLGSLLLVLPRFDLPSVSAVWAAAGIGYVASAVARAKLLGRQPNQGETAVNPNLGSQQSAVAI